MTEIMFLRAYLVLLEIKYAKQSGIRTGISVGAEPPELTEKSQDLLWELLSKVFIWALAETFAC